MSNYTYTFGEDGEEQRSPQQGQPIFIPIGGPPMPPPEDPLMNEKQLTPQLAMEYHKVRIRNGHSQARPAELRIILDSMREIRDAIQSVSVGEGDKGSGERPPLAPTFDEINRGKLQNAYLRLAERCINYTDHMFVKQLDILITDEIKKS